MKRNQYSYSKCLLVFIFIIIVFQFCRKSKLEPNDNLPPIDTTVVSITKIQAKPNPTGLAFGFWDAYFGQDLSLQNFGRRPVNRVGFFSWESYETSKGQYNFANAFNAYKTAHQYGNTIYGALNMTFMGWISKRKSTIPDFYVDSITNPVTRQAAKNFVYAYVQEALCQVGSLVLTIDYETCSNFKLMLTDTAACRKRAEMWGAWYVEAAATARKAAADLGLSGNLKLQPILNGNPLEDVNIFREGPQHNQWLVEVIKASDYLALDTYHSMPQYSNTSAQTTFDIIKFWIDNYACNSYVCKDVIITENGFNTVTEKFPGITREKRSDKLTGTEADQAVYYQNLFNQLADANKPGGIFKNKVRSMCFWCIVDNKAKEVTDDERYFGIIGLRDDNKTTYNKPALPVVQSGIAAMEKDAFSAPAIYNSGTKVTDDLLKGTGSVSLTYSEGNQYDYLRYIIPQLKKSNKYNLQIETANAGNIILNINDKWMIQPTGTSFNIDVSAYCKADEANIIELYFTSEKFPFVQIVKSVKLIEL